MVDYWYCSRSYSFSCITLCWFFLSIWRINMVFLTFLIIVVVSIIGLSVIATNDKIHVDAKLIMVWFLGMLTIITLERFM